MNIYSDNSSFFGDTINLDWEEKKNRESPNSVTKNEQIPLCDKFLGSNIGEEDDDNDEIDRYICKKSTNADSKESNNLEEVKDGKEEEKQIEYLTTLMAGFVPKKPLMKFIGILKEKDLLKTIVNPENTLKSIEFLCHKKKNSKEKSEEKFEETLKLKRGRKIKGSTEMAKHKRESFDNNVYKVKSNFLNYVLNLLNDCINPGDFEFFIPSIDGFYKLKFDEFAKNIKKKFNEELMTKTLKEIYSSKISSKYLTKDPDHNKNLFEEFENRQETQEAVLKISSLTYRETLDIFREIDNLEAMRKIQGFEEKIKKMKKVDDFIRQEIDKSLRDEKSKENIFDYICSLMVAIYGYEKFFEVKKGRDSRKKKNEKYDLNEE